FGSLYLGRFCLGWVMTFFWEALVIFILAYYFKSSPGPARRKYAWALGILLGTGFFVSVSWISVALSVSLAVFFFSREDKGTYTRFFLPVLILAGLFLYLF